MRPGSKKTGGGGQASPADALVQLHRKLGKPLPGDWLAVHYEPGQSFQEYLKGNPPVPDDIHTTLYIQPLGQFTDGQEKVVKLTADFMERWFGARVKIEGNIPLSVVPESARRIHPSWGDSQLFAGYILENVLLPRRPGDAVGYLALTASDLWPGEGWNFVFGQASLSERVGVWSLYRKGNPDGTKEDFAVALRRTLQTAVHETGHMIGMLHCTLWECAMNGSNSLQESDRRPLALCPECLKKLWWATKVDPVKRFRDLRDFCAANGLEREEKFFSESLKRLEETR